MIKRLTYFTDDAWSLDWEQFKEKHEHHVLVIVPLAHDQAQKSATDRYDSIREDETRPPINDDYRVGILHRPGEHAQAGPITVGRASGNNIVVSNIEVSKQHALFEVDGDQWTIQDCGSTNGTYVNSARIDPDQKVELTSSDAVKIGPGVSAVFFSPAGFYQFLRSNEVRQHLAE